MAFYKTKFQNFQPKFQSENYENYYQSQFQDF